MVSSWVVPTTLTDSFDWSWLAVWVVFRRAFASSATSVELAICCSVPMTMS